ncbi:DNA replication/repair protein RecF [bacterium]|nr:DNA replication/repair protein RecF [bacterium]
MSAMRLNWLKLTNFRNYQNLRVNFARKNILLLGNNAVGKTNLLEGIYLLAFGKSFKAETTAQMILWGKDFAVVEGEVESKREKITLLMQLKKEKQGKTSKQFFVNGVQKPRKEFLQTFFALIFRPEDIRLLSGSPQRRRCWLNEVLEVLDWRYRQSLRLYHKALVQRNRLLDLIRENKASRRELFYWDNALVKNGQYLIEERKKLVGFINLFFQNAAHQFLRQLKVNYLPSSITLEKLQRSQPADIQNGWTGCGPHRDVLTVEGENFAAADKNIAFWGSRGQQRLAVLGLKLAQAAFLFEKTKTKPVLLLDDIFSELDQSQQELLKETFVSHQVIVTATEMPSGEKQFWEKVIFLPSGS